MTSENKRDQAVTVLFTREEKQRLEEAANKVGLSDSSFLRMKALEVLEANDAAVVKKEG